MKIQVYVKGFCPYCNQVEEYLSNKGVDYERIELSDKLDLYEKLKRETGHRTVPQIFINDKFIGGADDFSEYVKTNKL